MVFISCMRLCRKISERIPKEQVKKRIKMDNFSKMIFDEDEDFSFLRSYTQHGYEDRHYLQKILFSVKRPNVVFPLNSEDIQILSTPANFYNKLKELIRKSKERIILSSLYLGTGPMEMDLMNLIKKQVNQNPGMKLSFLLDHHRGNRINSQDGSSLSSKSLLQPLASKAEASFFLSPLYGSFIRRYLFSPVPQFNELAAVQHMKCYIFDNTVLISGANLSELYFTNRQDRYICLHNQGALCDYLSEVISFVSRLGMQLKENGSLEPHSSCPYPILSRGKDRRYLQKAVQFDFEQLEKKFQKPETDWLDYNTLIIPRLQMNCFGINHDREHCEQVFKGLQGVQSAHISSGYFNLHNDYRIALANYRGYNTVNILVPSLDSNGFSGGKGIKKYVPAAYYNLVYKFMKHCDQFRVNVRIFTYERPGWTFHAKGMWVDIDEGTHYFEFGSSNYGRRSANRDLELQFSLVTIRKRIHSIFQEEKNELWKYAKPLDDLNDIRKLVPFPSRIISFLGKSYL
ncbi:phosphatidylglycerophosphate synthase 1 [Brevipalpus obovatus]|uniref:phosphatidylglycerophosphate synthase 1 n=1 Tax=Brevipalpus obovatus TaxID=246614 RepID=UPI003D9F0CF7